MILGTPTYLVFGLRLLKIILPDLLWCSQPPASFISDPRATSSPASEAPKARVCTGGVRPQGFMDQLLSLSRSQQHGEPCTKGSEVGSVQHAGPAAGVSVTVISPATGAQKQPPRHPPTASQGLWHGLTSLQTLPTSTGPGLCLTPSCPARRRTRHFHEAVSLHLQARGAEEQHVPEGTSGSSMSEVPRDLPRASPGPCLHV